MGVFIVYVCGRVWPPFAPIIFGSWPETPVAEISDEERLVSLWRRNTKRWEFGKWEFFFAKSCEITRHDHHVVTLPFWWGWGRNKQPEILRYSPPARHECTRVFGDKLAREQDETSLDTCITSRWAHQIRGSNLLQPLWNPRLFSKWHFQILIWQDKNLVEKLVHDFAVENWVLKFSGKKGLRHLERLAGWTFWGAAGLLHSLTAQNRMISIPNSAHVLRWDMMIWSLWFLW